MRRTKGGKSAIFRNSFHVEQAENQEKSAESAPEARRQTEKESSAVRNSARTFTAPVGTRLPRYGVLRRCRVRQLLGPVLRAFGHRASHSASASPSFAIHGRTVIGSHGVRAVRLSCLPLCLCLACIVRPSTVDLGSARPGSPDGRLPASVAGHMIFHLNCLDRSPDARAGRRSP